MGAANASRYGFLCSQEKSICKKILPFFNNGICSYFDIVTFYSTGNECCIHTFDIAVGHSQCFQVIEKIMYAGTRSD